MKKTVILLLMTFSLMSFSQEPKLDDKYINPTQYKMRLDFIQKRCRMLENMFEKQYEKEELQLTLRYFICKWLEA